MPPGGPAPAVDSRSPTPRQLGRTWPWGRDYVDQHYQWPVLIGRYARFLTEVVDRGKGVRGVF